MTTLHSIYSGSLHNSHFQDDTKHISASKVHTYQFYLDIHVFECSGDRNCFSAGGVVLRDADLGAPFWSSWSGSLENDKATKGHIMAQCERYKGKAEGGRRGSEEGGVQCIITRQWSSDWDLKGGRGRKESARQRWGGGDTTDTPRQKGQQVRSWVCAYKEKSKEKGPERWCRIAHATPKQLLKYARGWFQYKWLKFLKLGGKSVLKTWSDLLLSFQINSSSNQCCQNIESRSQNPIPSRLINEFFKSYKPLNHFQLFLKSSN